MDKEAQEKIANRIDHRTYTGFPEYDMKILVGNILDDLEELGYRKLPEGKPPIVPNPYTTEYKYQCSMDAGMPQNLIVNDDGYVGFAEGQQAQREVDIKWYDGG